MSIAILNPFVRNVAVYEKLNKNGERIAYDSRIFYVLSGGISVSVDKTVTNMTRGQLIFIPAGKKYKLSGKYFRIVAVDFDLTAARSNMTDRLTPVSPELFTPDGLRDAELFAPFDRVIYAEELESERDSFERMYRLFISAEGHYRAQLSAVLKMTLVKVAELCESSLPVRMIEQLDNYIRDNISDDISNTEIGAVFGYHPFYVSQKLKECKGQTLRQYIISYKLKLSCSLLAEGSKSINEIAEECGFTDASYFAKTFKSAFGMTPKDYRNKYKEEFV